MSSFDQDKNSNQSRENVQMNQPLPSPYSFINAPLGGATYTFAKQPTNTVSDVPMGSSYASLPPLSLLVSPPVASDRESSSPGWNMPVAPSSFNNGGIGVPSAFGASQTASMFTKPKLPSPWNYTKPEPTNT
jgi:hypothetical protein